MPNTASDQYAMFFCGEDDSGSATASEIAGVDRFSKGIFTIMQTIRDVSGQAALTICESLLLALNDCKILPENEVLGVLRDAASTHRNAAESGENVDFNTSVANLINCIIEGGNSVRHPEDEAPIPPV